MPSINLIGVTKRFGKITATNHVDLEIHDGEYVCVLGPTGSGKTTLLRLMAGIIKPDEGEIYINNEPVNEIPPQERNTVYVPQQYALFPHIKVLDNVAFGPLAKGVDRKKAVEISMQMLDLTRLGWRADSYPKELSGGMQQRVALARGLASGAKLLLLDEPLGALDARLRVELRYSLKKLLKDSKLTAVHVTHDQEEAFAVADRIVVLREGRIQQYGTPFHIYHRPTNIFVANFVGGANFLEGLIVERGVEGSLVELRGGLEVNVQDNSYLPGEMIVVVIREEFTRVKSRQEGEINSFLGKVLEIRFVGAMTIFEVQLENGGILKSKVPTALTEPFSKGERVFVHFSPGDTLVYPYPSMGLFRELEAI